MTFTLMVYDPRNAQDLSVIAHPFSQGTTTSVSAMVPISLFGLTGYHTLRVVYSSAEGFNFDEVPQLFLPPGSQTKLTKRGYYFGSYSLQEFLWQDPENPGRGWGFFAQIAGSDGNPNPIGNTVIIGIGGSTPGRPDDRWGIAWCDYLFSRQLSKGLVALGGGLNDESVLEAYYDAVVVDHVRIGPDRDAAVARRLRGRDQGKSAARPPQRSGPIDAALRASTMGPAYQLGMEREIGSIEVGKLADLVVLEKNLFEVASQNIHTTKVLMTVMNGNVTHEQSA